MYKLQIIDRQDNVRAEKEVGHWLDHARERFAGARSQLHNAKVKLQLVDGYDNNVLLEHDQREQQS